MTQPLELQFGYPGNSFPYLGIGWSIQENGGTWMLGEESTLIISRPLTPGDYRLDLDLSVVLKEGKCEFQRLGISVNGNTVCNSIIAKDTILTCWIPWSLIGGPMKSVIVFSHPDFWSFLLTEGHGDPRDLSFSLRHLTLSLLTERQFQGKQLVRVDNDHMNALIAQQQDVDAITMHELMLSFESVGSNCEFGFVQRFYGADPLSLFRFSYTPIGGLIKALEGNFHTDHFSGKASLTLNRETREYELIDQTHGFEWHTWQYEGRTDAELLEKEELIRLPYLIRRFYEVLQDAEKIIVIRDEEGPIEHETIIRLLDALRRHGAVTLLWVGLAEGLHKPGDVERLGKHLIRGWLDRLTPRELANSASMSLWGVICRRAMMLHNEVV